MRKSFALLTLVMLASGVGPALADGCYICNGGTYVRFSGSDDQNKRKAAKACGCHINGTRGECGAANLKVLCSVSNENADQRLALLAPLQSSTGE